MWRAISIVLLLFVPSIAQAAPTTVRVYQKTNALQEFSTMRQAVSYAQRYDHAYVERISSRAIVWHNIPRYIVTELRGRSWTFDSKYEAIRFAKKRPNSIVRDTTRGGWAWHNIAHPGYTLYQREKTLPIWKFSRKEDAIREAKKWSHAHIIDNATNRWIWDDGTNPISTLPQYVVAQHDKQLGAPYTSLKEAIKEAMQWAHATVTTMDGDVVYRNTMPYTVHNDDGRKLASFASVAPAIAYAQTRTNATIYDKATPIWTNKPYYRIMQSGREIGSESTFEKAVQYAKQFASSTVTTDDGFRMWASDDALIVLGWHGGVSLEQVIAHINDTKGLDWSSPTWFSLADANGTLTDLSDAATARQLQQRGVRVLPLVHNMFDAKRTTAFLANETAMQQFIQSLVSRLDQLGVDGVNIDFESLAGSDRDRFTSFVEALSQAAKRRKLIVTIDLPRGDASWNDRAAFDRVAIANAVDYIAIMAYDQHYRLSTRAGPVAGLDWTEEGIQQYLNEGIPRQKLLLGIPFYSRIFGVKDTEVLSTKALLMKHIPALMQDTKATVTRDLQASMDKVTYTQNGQTFVFWKEDAQTVRKRIALAKKYDLAGIAIWRLGYEPPVLWDALITDIASKK